ncbi:DUF2514 domain-containing protein [Pseudomonas sp. B21-048]|uniref:DUF2514 domain-containing protein n=1 Tax=Pseudomonas sp. B21-048 TaxID=2895490 RepID=UPI00215F15CB|nr:DUF2514 domain-containing protein [Pseudomonas sp. B21-048]UVK96437.1 DUF2514 domain-containing protein [Pseudomonas sp. B21-048]
MTSTWLRILPYVAAMLLVAGTLFGAYHHGVTVTEEKWQGEWNARDTRDAEAKAQNEAAERTKEQAYQQSINKAIQNGQQIIDQATADAASARAFAGGVQLAAGNLARRLAASEASGNSCTAAASKAAAHSARVLADVLNMADAAAGVMAANADQARGRGMTCTAAYDALVNQK